MVGCGTKGDIRIEAIVDTRNVGGLTNIADAGQG
jgi:hypothetical protein